MMRHIFCILLVALVIGCQSRRTSSVQSGPTLEISDETLTEGTSDTIRFGRLHSGETGIKRFRLQNTSSRTWVVTRYEVSCECVTPEFDRRPLKPGEEIPAFRPGDTVEVNVKIQEGNNSRIQAFTGVVIARQGGGVRETFVVRKISFGTGVERRFPLHSPVIDSIKVVRKGRVRRAKLYYLRNLRGKAARIVERRDNSEK